MSAEMLLTLGHSDCVHHHDARGTQRGCVQVMQWYINPSGQVERLPQHTFLDQSGYRDTCGSDLGVKPLVPSQIAQVRTPPFPRIGWDARTR